MMMYHAKEKSVIQQDLHSPPINIVVIHITIYSTVLTSHSASIAHPYWILKSSYYTDPCYTEILFQWHELKGLPMDACMCVNVFYCNLETSLLCFAV